jgi:hypothetical protein
LFPSSILKDKSEKKIAAIGPKLFFYIFYAILAISAMVFFNSTTPVHFTGQLLAHGVLLFFLFLGLFYTIASSEKAEEVYFRENQNRDGIIEMKKAIKDIQLKLALMDNIPKEATDHVNDLQENLCYLSPGNSNDAFALESEFVEEARSIVNCLTNTPFNLENVIHKMKKCKLIYAERKNIYSK